MERTHAIHTLGAAVPAQHQLKSIDVAELARAELPLKKPIFVDKFGWAMPQPAISALTAFSEVEFPRSDNYKATGSGRGAKLANFELDHFRNKSKDIWRDGTAVCAKLTSAEASYLSAPWMFGYSAGMKACAPEFSFLGSAKYTLKGDRSVVLCRFDELQRFAEPMRTLEHPDGQELTLQYICDQLSEASSAEQLAALIAKVRSVLFAKVGGDSLLVVPWGWVVAEASLNQSETVGIRWMGVADQVDETIITLCESLMPLDGKVKQGTAVSFLYKLVSLGGGQTCAGLSPALAAQLAASAVVKTEAAAQKKRTGAGHPQLLPPPPKIMKSEPTKFAS